MSYDFLNIIHSKACVIENSEMFPDFDATPGTKQGCVWAPLLFTSSSPVHDASIVAFKSCKTGITFRYRTDGNVFDLRGLHAMTKVQIANIRDVLFADTAHL